MVFSALGTALGQATSPDTVPSGRMEPYSANLPFGKNSKKSQRNKREYVRQVWQVGHCYEERTKVMGSFTGRLTLALLFTTHKHSYNDTHSHTKWTNGLIIP